MAGIISTGSTKLYWPGIKDMRKVEYSQTSDPLHGTATKELPARAWEEPFVYHGLHPRASRPKAGHDVRRSGQGPMTRIVSTTFAARLHRDHGEIQNNSLYEGEQRVARRPMRSAAGPVQESQHAPVLIRAFTSGYVGGDGVTLANLAHAARRWHLCQNRPVAGAPLSEASLEDALISIADFDDDKVC